MKTKNIFQILNAIVWKVCLPLSVILAVVVIVDGCAALSPAAPGAVESIFGGTSATTHKVIAPENANKPTTHTATKTVKRTFAGAVNASDPAPALASEETTETVTVKTGTSYQDTSRELAAKYDALDPVLWVGIALILIGIVGAIVALKMGWPSIAVLTALGGAGSGVAMICLFSFLPGINPYIGLSGLGLLLIIPLVYYAYKKGSFDSRDADAGKVLPTPPNTI